MTTAAAPAILKLCLCLLTAGTPAQMFVSALPKAGQLHPVSAQSEADVRGHVAAHGMATGQSWQSLLWMAAN